MPVTVVQDVHGPDWPLGFIAVVTPGIPVQLTSLVDPTNLNDPGSSNRTGLTREYTSRCQQLIIQAIKPGVAHGMVDNTGYVYIVRKSGSRDDPGQMIKRLSPSETFFLASAPLVKDVFSPYRYYVDGDTAGDGVIVTLLIF